jgi:anthranilate phosphoribosyltransferase
MATGKAAEPAERMKNYLDKIATGPEMGRDLTEQEAEDALAMILAGDVSPVRAGVFLVAGRMKRETLAENLGYWRALDRATVKRQTTLTPLLQVADPFDGCNRAPYLGFYALPVIAALGLPVYGHSTLSLPPKFGVTFEDILHKHYGIPANLSLDRRIRLLETFRFGYLSTRQTHPSLENLRGLRQEIVKRTALSTFEKMLMPLAGAPGGNFLATGYFHKGYEIPMLAVAEQSGFDRFLLVNGVEGTTLFAVHKPARAFIKKKGEDAEERRLTLQNMFSPADAAKIDAAYQNIKSERLDLPALARLGESGLAGEAPAATLIACQAGGLCAEFGIVADFQTGFTAAETVLKNKTARLALNEFLAQAASGKG